MADHALEAHKRALVGDHAGAIELLDVAIQAAPDSVVVRCNRASLYFRLDLHRRVVKECDAVLKMDASYARAYLLKGLAQKAMKKVKQARRTWELGVARGSDLDVVFILHDWLHERHDGLVDSNVVHGGAGRENTNGALPHGSVPHTPVHKTLHDSGGDRSGGAFEDPPPLEASGGSEDVDGLLCDPRKLERATTEAAKRGIVQHGTGRSAVDSKIAVGYLYVNTGKLADAVQLFSELLAEDKKLIGAYLGRGTAQALGGNLDQAIADFSLAIKHDNTCADAWKRRGQARAAKGFGNDAIFDLTKASKLKPDHETFHQRGLVYYKQKNFIRALSDFNRAVEHDPSAVLSWNHIGLCLNAIGRSEEALEAHSRALALNKEFKEALVNMGQACKELGRGEDALSYFRSAIQLHPKYAHAYHLRGICHFSRGDHALCVDDCRMAVTIDDTLLDARQHLGVALHGLGRYKEAVQEYSRCVEQKVDHVTWYNREVALFSAENSKRPWRSFNIDREMDPYFKEAWCKRLHPATLVRYRPRWKTVRVTSIPEKTSYSAEEEQVISIADKLGRSLQNNCAGYMPNRRQHRMCGLAILEMAQVLRKYWRDRQDIVVPENTASGCKQAHPFGWRDLYDICVRWRQFSEPNDPVWWVDLLSPEQFEEGFGSHTPMITGQTNVIRYYPMFERAFSIMKQHIGPQCNLSGNTLRAAHDASDCKELYEVMRKDFYIVTPCYSISREGHALDGTRITLQYAAPEGYEFSIRTPGTPPRWEDYAVELDHVWNELTKAAREPEIDVKRCTRWILTIAFYWYNFMPLSRGSAACGYIGILAMYLSLGFWMSAPLQRNQQVDWEAILTSDVSHFINKISSWMEPALEPSSLTVDTPDLCDLAPTLASAIQLLNAPATKS